MSDMPLSISFFFLRWHGVWRVHGSSERNYLRFLSFERVVFVLPSIDEVLFSYN